MSEVRIVESSDNLSYYSVRSKLLSEGYREDSEMEDTYEVFSKMNETVILTRH